MLPTVLDGQQDLLLVEHMINLSLMDLQQSLQLFQRDALCLFVAILPCIPDSRVAEMSCMRERNARGSL